LCSGTYTTRETSTHACRSVDGLGLGLRRREVDVEPNGGARAVTAWVVGRQVAVGRPLGLAPLALGLGRALRRGALLRRACQMAPFPCCTGKILARRRSAAPKQGSPYRPRGAKQGWPRKKSDPRKTIIWGTTVCTCREGGAVGGWRAWRWCWRWSKEDRKGGAVVGAARRPARGDVELSRHRRGRRDERRRLRTTMSQLPMLMALLRTMRSTWRSPRA
jgi:hypothetical protein